MPHFFLLLGAGFSRNWGGWLADAAFEYLLGCPQVDEDIRGLLWSHKRTGGFEGALAHLQAEFARNRNPAAEQRLDKLQKAIFQMFADMDKAFAAIIFEPQNDLKYMVGPFLMRFDAIFTLNQDLLLERYYLDGNVGLSRRWTGCQIPGMQIIQSNDAQHPATARRSPMDSSKFEISRNMQPYFKLHGSSNWIDGDRQLLVMGGNKSSTIEQHPILKWNFERFEEYLSQPGTRLMVIGYGFGDDHVNQAIRKAADQGHLSLFIINPHGVDVLDKNRHATLYASDSLFAQLQPHLIGASRRTIIEIFGSDRVEHGKVMRFFTST